MGHFKNLKFSTKFWIFEFSIFFLMLSYIWIVRSIFAHMLSYIWIVRSIFAHMLSYIWIVRSIFAHMLSHIWIVRSIFAHPQAHRRQILALGMRPNAKIHRTTPKCMPVQRQNLPYNAKMSLQRQKKTFALGMLISRTGSKFSQRQKNSSAAKNSRCRSTNMNAKTHDSMLAG